MTQVLAVTQVLGDLLPLAAAVALSPFPIVAVVLVLSTPRASSNGLAFAAGWITGLSAALGLALVVTGAADDSGSGDGTVLAWVRIALGVLLLGAAVRKWRGRPRPGDEVAMPPWMAQLDDVAPLRAAVLGAALGGANPKNLALTVAAAATIAQAGLTASEALVDVVLFVVLASSTVLGAVAAHLVAGDRAARALGATKAAMLEHDAAIMAVIFVLFGAKLLGDGLAGL